MEYLNFEKEQKGYKEFHLTKESVLANIGKRIVYVCPSDIDSRRGFVFPRYARLAGIKYSYVLLNQGHESVDKRNVVECGIEE